MLPVLAIDLTNQTDLVEHNTVLQIISLVSVEEESRDSICRCRRTNVRPFNKNACSSTHAIRPYLLEVQSSLHGCCWYSMSIMGQPQEIQLLVCNTFRTPPVLTVYTVTYIIDIWLNLIILFWESASLYDTSYNLCPPGSVLLLCRLWCGIDKWQIDRTDPFQLY